MKAKSVFIFSSIIVIALAILAVVAFAYSLSEMPADQIPERMNLKAEDITESENTTEPEQNMAEGILCFLKIQVSPQDAMKILLLLFSVGSVIATQVRNKNVFQVSAGIIYALVIAFLLGKWGIYMACAERGYEAVGGEYCMILIAGQAAGMAIGHFFNSLGDVK